MPSQVRSYERSAPRATLQSAVVHVGCVMTLCLFAFCIVASANDAISIKQIQSPSEIEVRWRTDRSAAEAIHKSDDGQVPTLSISLLHASGQAGPAMFANQTWRGNQLILTPRYRLTPGMTYVVTARPLTGAFIRKTYSVPMPASKAAPRVLAIYPSSGVLPANCLKFYVHFSEPIQQGRRIFDQIQLLDKQGELVHDPWRRSELWNIAGDRLTLWIHPGRIKKGVNLREESGPVLHPNRSYQLVITDGVRSLDGRVLGKPFVKDFVTQKEDDQRPNPGHWKAGEIRRGTRMPLTVSLDEPLDRALLSRMISVMSNGLALNGTITIEDAERSWTFTPDRPWTGNSIMLQVNERLEDLAGNTPVRVFDRDLTSDLPQRPNLRLSVPILSDE